MVGADDVDLVVACLPPAFNREVVLGGGRGRQARRLREAARRVGRGRRRRCSPPAGRPASSTAWLPGYRWSPAVRAIGQLIADGELGAIRSIRASFMLDYAADPDVPFLWRFRKAWLGRWDRDRYRVSPRRLRPIPRRRDRDGPGAIAATFITERPLPGADAVGNRGGRAGAGERPARPGRSTSRMRPPRWSPSPAARTACSRRAGSRSASVSRSRSRSSARRARPTGTSSARTSSTSACPATRARSGSGGCS